MKYSYTLLAAAALVLASPVPVEHAHHNTPAAGCQPAYPGTFGIVLNRPTSMLTNDRVETLGAQKQIRQAISQIPDGQIQAPTTTALTTRPAPSTMVASSSKQSTSTQASSATPASSASKQSTTSATTPCPSSSSTAKQSTTSTSECKTTATTSKQESSSSMSMKPPVSQIGDGQIQNPGPSQPATTKPATTKPATTQPATTQPAVSPKQSSSSSMSMKPPVSQIGDGQIQNPGPSQPPATTRRATTTTTTSTITATTCSGTSAGCKPPSTNPSTQPTTSPSASMTMTPKISGTPVTVIPDGQPQVPTGKPQTWNSIGACATDSTLKLTLSNGILKDARGWQGYIAANRQLQFDNPPQDGAVITSGFSVCNNGSLALNGNNVFWECLSGNFYNLYDTNIAPQCRPVALQVTQLVKC